MPTTTCLWLSISKFLLGCFCVFMKGANILTSIKYCAQALYSPAAQSVVWGLTVALAHLRAS